MNRSQKVLVAALLAAGLAPALAAEPGPYAQVALGQTQYNQDCSWYSCNGGRATPVKLGVGYQFGTFALESWATNWGSATIPFDDHVRLRSLGLNGAWRLHFGSVWEGVLRAGAAEVQQTRQNENFKHLEGTFGLGLALNLNAVVAVELAWDMTTSTGGSSQIGSVLAQAYTAGLRLRF